VQGSDLRAKVIRIGTRARSLSATDGVRHTLARKGERGIGPIGGEEPTVLLCRQLDYDDASRTARYSDNALLRSGEDEIRAPLIVLEEPAPGRRRLTASGGVQSKLHPRAEKGSQTAPQPVDARSKEMVYEEAAKRVVYTGEVEIRQGDILTKSPEAVVVLGADGRTMEKLLAGAPVDVRQGTKRANGERGTYTPRDGTFVLVGEKVVLQDVDRRIEGRTLTFQAGSDRIRVDGREEVRTEAVFKKKEPPTP
jgi:lipopolysaccharide transport protein LptA